jgi:hypothetical protein
LPDDPFGHLIQLQAFVLGHLFQPRRLGRVPGFLKRGLDDPDELTMFERGEDRIVQMGELSFGRTILERPMDLNDRLFRSRGVLRVTEG